MTKTHVMVDLETLGTAPGSVILTLGAVLFDPRATDLADPDLDPEKLGDHRFYRRVDLESCREVGMTSDEDTERWWGEQSPGAREEAFTSEPRIRLGQVLEEFSSWFYRGATHRFVWSHGSSFDVVLLNDAYARAGRHGHPPWKFWNIRDTRTLFDFTGTVLGSQTNRHHALWDALHQAGAVQRAYETRKQLERPDA